MYNTTRCTELKERFGDMVSAILNTYGAQNSRRIAFVTRAGHSRLPFEKLQERDAF